MSDETQFPNRFVNKARIYLKESDNISSFSQSLRTHETEMSPCVVNDGERTDIKLGRSLNRMTVDNIDEVREARNESSRLTVVKATDPNKLSSTMDDNASSMGKFRESIFSTYGKNKEKGRPQIAINWQHPYYKTEEEFQEDKECTKIVWKK